MFVRDSKSFCLIACNCHRITCGLSLAYCIGDRPALPVVLRQVCERALPEISLTQCQFLARFNTVRKEFDLNAAGADSVLVIFVTPYFLDRDRNILGLVHDRELSASV